MQNKYSEFVSKLLAGESLRIVLAKPGDKEAIRSAISREKTRQESALQAFEIPIENTRIHWKKINGSNLQWEVSLKSFNLGFEILDEVPSLEEDETKEKGN